MAHVLVEFCPVVDLFFCRNCGLSVIQLVIQLYSFGIWNIRYNSISYEQRELFPVNLSVSALWQICTQQIVFLVTGLIIQWTPESFQHYCLIIWTLYLHLDIAGWKTTFILLTTFQSCSNRLVKLLRLFVTFLERYVWLWIWNSSIKAIILWFLGSGRMARQIFSI